MTAFFFVFFFIGLTVIIEESVVEASLVDGLLSSCICSRSLSVASLGPTSRSWSFLSVLLAFFFFLVCQLMFETILLVRLLNQCHTLHSKHLQVLLQEDQNHPISMNQSLKHSSSLLTFAGFSDLFLWEVRGTFNRLFIENEHLFLLDF